MVDVFGGAWVSAKAKVRSNFEIQAGGRVTAQASIASGNFEFRSSARLKVLSKFKSGYSGIPTPRGFTRVDPLWVALEIDVWDSSTTSIVTIRLCNRGVLSRIVNGVLYQYDDRLITPFLLGTRLATDFYQTPLRGKPNGGTITWSMDPGFASWFSATRYHWKGRTFRVYEGRTFDPDNANVDTDLTLVYTGSVVNVSFDLATPLVTMQTTDKSGDLNKVLIDETYPQDFAIEGLRGKTVPELWGRRLSIEPVLEDEDNLVYRVSRKALNDITEVRVGGVPWRRIDGTPPVSTYVITQSTGPSYLGYYLTSADVAFWTTFGASIGLGTTIPTAGAGEALYTIVQQVGPSYIGNLDAADVAFWQGTGASVTPYVVGSVPPPAFHGPPPVMNTGAPTQGEWLADLPSGTFQLGAVTLGADVRCDAQALNYDTFDTAALFIEICALRGVGYNAAVMAQLHLDCPGLVGFYAGTDGINTLDALDRIAFASLCGWTLDNRGELVVWFIDGPELAPTNLNFFASSQQIQLDSANFDSTASDPIPKEIMTLSMTDVLPPPYRFRVGYAQPVSEETAFLGGVTDEDQVTLGNGRILDYAPGSGGFQLTPAEGDQIRQNEPQAQDVFIDSLAWREAEAIFLRSHTLQRVTGNLPRVLCDATVWIDSTALRLFDVVLLNWIEITNRTQAAYGGKFRIFSAIMSIGGGPSQVQLWGYFGTSSTPIFVPPPLPPPTTGGGGSGGGGTGTPTSIISIDPPDPEIFDTTPLGTVVATIMVYMSDGSMYTGDAPVFVSPDFDDGGRFIITGGVSGPGPYSLVLNPAGPGLPLSLSIEFISIATP